MKGKVLLVIVLYVILGAIGLYNFGLHDYLYGLYAQKTSPQVSTWKRVSVEVRNLRSAVAQEKEDDLSKDSPDQAKTESDLSVE